MKSICSLFQSSVSNAASVPSFFSIPRPTQSSQPSLVKLVVVAKNLKTGKANRSYGIRAIEGNGSIEEDEDADLCPVDCVREFKTDEELLRILDKARMNKSLVVVDFYRTSCGSCKYIEQGFAKLCRGSGDRQGSVVFLKHNVIDEYDEQSEVADRLRIKAVPLFHFYKDGVLVESFPTRDKERILAAIEKYA